MSLARFARAATRMHVARRLAQPPLPLAALSRRTALTFTPAEKTQRKEEDEGQLRARLLYQSR